MTKETKEMYRQILDFVTAIEYVKVEDMPNIDRDMDQVTSFMEGEPKKTRRYEDDKILTKTMINNYAKNHLLPAPDSKRYSREHMVMLLFIYYFKNILSITDIQSLLQPLSEKYFHQSEGMDMTDVYNEVFSMIHDQRDYFLKDLYRRYQAADASFQDFPDDDQEFLKKFSFICLLSFDVYMKKMLVERLIDSLDKEEAPSGKKNRKKK